MRVNDEAKDESAERRQRFVHLFSKCQGRLQRYIMTLLPNMADADEVFAETSIRLWEQFDDYDSERDFGAWARSIAHFHVLTRRKKIARRRVVLSDVALENLADRAWSMEQPSGGRQEALRLCLQKLPGTPRDLVDQFYAADRRLADIAESLGQTPTAVRKRLSRIRMQLRKCVDRQLAAEVDR